MRGWFASSIAPLPGSEFFLLLPRHVRKKLR